MAEPETAILGHYTSSKSANKSVPDTTVYAIDGSKVPLSVLDKVMEEYDATEKTPPGFTVHKIGTKTETARTGYEKYFNQPLQEGAQALGNMMPKMTPQEQAFLERMNPDANMVSAMKTVPRFLAQSVNTPGKLGAALATAAIAPAVAPVSGVAPMIARTLAAGAGTHYGNKLMGTGATEREDTPIMRRVSTQTAVTMIATAASEGLLGVLSKIGGRSVADTAVKQSQVDILNEIRKTHPQLSLSGKQGVEDFASTPANLERLVQTGIKTVKKEGDNAAKQFLTEVQSSLPSGMTKGTRDKLETMSQSYKAKINDYLDNIGDVDKADILNKESVQMAEDITRTVVDEYKRQLPKNSTAKNQQYLERLNKLFSKYRVKERQFRDTAEVYAALKNHNPGGGYDSTKFQEYVKDQVYGHSDLYERTAIAAGRGNPGGVDYRANLPMDALRKYFPSIPNIPISPTRYTGKIRDLPPWQTIDIGTREAVDNFMKRKPQE